jgi:endoglucanase
MKKRKTINYSVQKSSLLFVLLATMMQTGCTQHVTERIQLNQVGYYTAAPKIAVLTGSVTADRFYITSSNLKDTLYTGFLGKERRSLYSTTTTRLADFSQFQKQGSYVLLVPGIGHSYVFNINDRVHREVAIASLKGFYYQRSDQSLEPQFAGKWHRSVGHPDTAVYIHPSAASKERPAESIIASPGGWYDAGDYNKYIVNSGITMATLLSAYEDFPNFFNSLSVNIPESEDAIPDILNEALYNLRWMLTMQDPFDGGVYHKCTNADFDGMVMPGVTREPRYAVQKSTAAALNFAAVTAQASRIFKDLERTYPGLSDSCQKAAIKAWQWAQKNPHLEYSQQTINSHVKPAITTGEYGDKGFDDEWLWAAAELFATTKDKSYYNVVNKHLNDSVNLPSWSKVGLLGYYTLLRQKQLPSFASASIQVMKDSVLKRADRFINKVSASAYNTVMGQSVSDFVWGSNSVAANQGILLINAYLLTKDKKYIDYALTNLDYLLGRNATGYSFITGIGSKWPMHPHHRPSVADGITEPVPGLLAGGPNPGRQDKCHYAFTEPETAYTDDDCSYASNEIAINWNAPLVYLSSAIEALQTEVGYTTIQTEKKKK